MPYNIPEQDFYHFTVLLQLLREPSIKVQFSGMCLLTRSRKEEEDSVGKVSLANELSSTFSSIVPYLKGDRF